jgi:hypothetical protein
MSNICKIAFLPDLHIGKPRLQPESIRDHLEKLFYSRIPELDLIVFGGDFFDSALTMNSDSGVYAAMIIDEVLTLAKLHKVFVRVVTGTFFHDRHQNKFFDIKKKYCGDIDGVPLLKVANSIELEFIKPLKLTLVYCPDNQVGDPSEQILELLKAHRVDKFDFLCSHGYFEYLLPKGIPHLPPNMLNYRLLSPHIRGRILNGHVHIPITYKKLISGGSFERFAHGEEHDKGYFILTYDTKTLEVSHEFVVNKYATTFATISIQDYQSIDECINDIEDKISIIRLNHGEAMPIYIRLDGLTGTDDFIIRYLDEKHQNVIVSIKSKTVQDVSYELDEITTSLPIITEQNLPELIYENIKDQNITLAQIKEYL